VGLSHPAHDTALASNANTVHTRVGVGIGKSSSESATYSTPRARGYGPPYLDRGALRGWFDGLLSRR